MQRFWRLTKNKQKKDEMLNKEVCSSRTKGMRELSQTADIE
jgi:hypothetical protein